MQKRSRLIIGVVSFAIAITLFLTWQNNAVGVTAYSVTSERLPEAFDGFRILQLSDLHNKAFGRDQSRLMKRVEAEAFDIIVITGDIADSRRYDSEPVLALIPQLTRLAPVYYVTGNHESDIADYERLEAEMLAYGVVVLRNRSIELKRDEAAIRLAGIDDPTMHFGTGFESVLIELASSDAGYTMLLSHRPEKLDLYSALDYDLVFSGHAHGGQIRLPFLGGVIAPHQGFFPDLTEGVHTMGNTSLVISRGLGNSLFPFRLFNPPELVLVTLEKSE